jgi:hypothetical protein
MSFLAEIKRRNVIRMVGLYLVGDSGTAIRGRFGDTHNPAQDTRFGDTHNPAQLVPR